MVLALREWRGAVIALGLLPDQKADLVRERARDTGATRAVIFSPTRFRNDALTSESVGVPVEHVDWSEIILYRFYYRLLREIDPSVLVVVDEALRTQNRHDLTYNCLRNFLQQTSNQIILSRFPLIDTMDDFMILVDLDSRTRWRRESFRAAMLDEIDLVVTPRVVSIDVLRVIADKATSVGYQREKRKLIDNIGSSDPHTIPRRLHIYAGRARAEAIEESANYVARNARMKAAHVETYEAAAAEKPRTAFDFCHRFIDWCDFLTATNTTEIRAIVSDLKVDEWYLGRFEEWGERLKHAYAALHR